MANRRMQPAAPSTRAEYETAGFMVAERLLDEVVLSGLQTILEDHVEEQIRSWIGAGLITEPVPAGGFATRVLDAWRLAGRPEVPAVPDNTAFLARALPDIVCCQPLLDLARDVLGTSDVAPFAQSCRFRMSLPRHEPTRIDWHQDVQCMRPAIGDDFVTFWIPLVDVDEGNSCIEVAPSPAHGVVHPADFSTTKYLTMRSDAVERLGETKPVPMTRGDVLCMNSYLPHRSMENRSERIRWSVDFRYRPDRRPPVSPRISEAAGYTS